MSAAQAKQCPDIERDKRYLWDNAPELRDAVRDDLTEWGKAVRGGMPDLGYPSRCPGITEDNTKLFRYDVDKVDDITRTFVDWNQRLSKMGDVNKRREGGRLILTLRFHFTSDRPAEAKAKVIGVSRRTFWRRVDEGMFRFWRLHY